MKCKNRIYLAGERSCIGQKQFIHFEAGCGNSSRSLAPSCTCVPTPATARRRQSNAAHFYNWAQPVVEPTANWHSQHPEQAPLRLCFHAPLPSSPSCSVSPPSACSGNKDPRTASSSTRPSLVVGWSAARCGRPRPAQSRKHAACLRTTLTLVERKVFPVVTSNSTSLLLHSCTPPLQAALKCCLFPACAPKVQHTHTAYAKAQHAKGRRHTRILTPYARHTSATHIHTPCTYTH